MDFLVYQLVGCFIALDVLELEKTVTSLLAGVGVIGLALGFAFQDTAANFVSGIFLAVRSPIDSGDIVQVGDIMGVVQKINLENGERAGSIEKRMTLPKMILKPFQIYYSEMDNRYYYPSGNGKQIQISTFSMP